MTDIWSALHEYLKGFSSLLFVCFVCSVFRCTRLSRTYIYTGRCVLLVCIKVKYIMVICDIILSFSYIFYEEMDLLERIKCLHSYHFDVKYEICIQFDILFWKTSSSDIVSFWEDGKYNYFRHCIFALKKKCIVFFFLIYTLID